jgi:hypothetical protein
MKKLLLVLFCTAATGATVASAQTPPARGERTVSASSTATFPFPIQHVEVEIREQSDSPLRLFVDEKTRGRLPGSPLTVRNDGTSAIAGVIIRVDVEPAGGNTMMMFGTKGLGPGESRMFAPPVGRGPEGGGKPVVSVDFILFSDGRTWGADTLGRSQHAKAFAEGQVLALSRLAELTAGQDNAEIQKAFNVFGASSFSEPNLPLRRDMRNIDYSARGYDNVIMILRRMPRETERGQDLARQLELAARQK